MQKSLYLLAALFLAPAAVAADETAAEKTAQIPLGDVPGSATARAELRNQITNPVAGKPEAIKDGKALFGQMNCSYCHGGDASGLMGPSLIDHYWRYGGTPGEIFKTIAEGRPQGMPSYGQMLPADSIWEVVAYIQSLGGTVEPTGSSAQGDQPGSGQPATATRATAPASQNTGSTQ